MKTSISALSCAPVTVQFHNQTLQACIVDGNPFVAMKPICENIGLQWEAQLKRIKRCPIISQGMSMMDIPSNGGIQQTLMLPLDYLNGWLFGVDANRVKPEIRDRLIEYQRECYRVLADHFMPRRYGLKAEPKTRKALPGCLTAEQQDVIKALVREKAESLPKNKQAKAAITCWSAIKSKFGVPYKQIPQDEFVRVVSLLARLPLEGELMDKPSEKTLTVDLDLPDGVKQLTLSFKSNPINPLLGGRWVIDHSCDTLTIRKMENGEFLTSSEKLAQFVGDSMGGMVKRQDLPKIIEQAAKRLGA